MDVFNPFSKVGEDIMIQFENIEEQVDDKLDSYMEYMVAKAKVAGLKASIKTFNQELQKLLANMPEQPKLVSDDTSVDVLKFSKREKNRLDPIFKAHGIETISDLTGWSKHELSQIRTVGPKTIREITLELKKLGYKLAED